MDEAPQLTISELEVSSSITNQHHSNSTSANPNFSSFRAANVIVYNSINMLRNGNSSLNVPTRGSIDRLNNVQSEDCRTICSTSSTMSLNKPFCKICHVGSSKNGDKLISPCRCSGTMQYVHCGCLLKWLEISNRSNEKPMSCELCAHEYSWHKKFNYRHMRIPKCSLKDMFLHLIFIATIGIMFFSALAPMLYKKAPTADLGSSSGGQLSVDQQNAINYKVTPEGNNPPTIPYRQRHVQSTAAPYYHHHHFSSQLSASGSNGRLARDEKFMLLCAASFFVSFFLAIYVQTKACDTLYGLIVKFICMNQTYYITEYDHGQLQCNSGNNIVNGKQQHFNEDLTEDRKSSQKS